MVSHAKKMVNISKTAADRSVIPSELRTNSRTADSMQLMVLTSGDFFT